MTGAMKPMSRIWLRARRSAISLLKDRSGIAATEFAVIVPIMLVMFFGTVEFSSGVAVDRKITLVAQTLSDLTSRLPAATDCTLSNSFAAAAGILTPYSAIPTVSKITELKIDPTTLVATVQWSRSATINSSGVVVLGAGRTVNSIVTIPTALAVAGTFVVWSEVSYLYTPAVGYVMNKAGVTLSDVAYTRPRQTNSITYTSACS
jgi:Flp pilus assembly protein TadG